MKNHLAIILSAFLAVSGARTASAEEIPADQLVVLQAAMQSYIDKNSVHGALLLKDGKSGTQMNLYPVKAHPMVMHMGQDYELCAEFKDADGKDMQVNFMVAASGKDYVVVEAALADKDMMMPGSGQPATSAN